MAGERVPYRDINDPQVTACLGDLPNRIWAGNEADRVRHVKARGAFMNLLANHLDQQGIFLSWLHAADHYLAANGIAPILQQAKHVRSLAWRAPTSAAVAERLQRDGSKMIFSLRAVVPIIVQLAHTHVRKELHLDWDWVGAAELGLAWFAMMEAKTFGNNEAVVTHLYVPYKPPAPPVEFLCKPLPEESRQTYLDRLEQESKRFIKDQRDELHRQSPKGTLYSNQDIDAYTEYFFRLAILHESPRHVGAFTIEGKRRGITVDHTNIKRQAKMASTWLGYGWSEANLAKLVLEIEKLLAEHRVN